MCDRKVRGIRVAPEYILKVQSALARTGLTHQGFADEVVLAKSTVQNFIYGKNVDRINFIQICTRLGLDWQKIFYVCEECQELIEDQRHPQTNQMTTSSYPEEFRALIQEKIRSFCGRQFVFDAFEQFIPKKRILPAAMGNVPQKWLQPCDLMHARDWNQFLYMVVSVMVCCGGF